MIHCFLCFGLLLFLPINALIIESINLKSLKLEIALSNEKNLFVFDVDETLITSKDPFFRSHNNLPANCLLIQSYFGDLDLFLDDMTSLRDVKKFGLAEFWPKWNGNLWIVNYLILFTYCKIKK